MFGSFFQCPSKIEWDRIPTDPVQSGDKAMIDTQVCSGSVQWVLWVRFLGQWLFLVPIRGGRWHITRQKEIYKWYFSCQLGDYMPPIPPFMGTRNNH